MHTYLSLCTEFYDLDKPDSPEDQIRFYESFAKEAEGPILEPMCGSGRLLVPLAQMGYEIDGADASPTMLAACRAKVEALGLSSRLYEGFLDELRAPSRYALAFIGSCSFSLITDLEQAQASLVAVANALLPNGKLVLEFERKREATIGQSPSGYKLVRRPDGATIALSWVKNLSDDEVARSLDRYELVVDGVPVRTELEEGGYRIYDPAAMEAMLTRAGFGRFRYWKARERILATPEDDTLAVECVRLPAASPR